MTPGTAVTPPQPGDTVRPPWEESPMEIFVRLLCKANYELTLERLAEQKKLKNSDK